MQVINILEHIGSRWVMFSEKDIEKIDSYLHKNFDIIFDFKFNGIMLLIGGAVKDLIMGEPINDLDFVLLTQEKPNIEKFLKKNKIQYKLSKYKRYHFIYNDIQIDMAVTNDLYCSGNLNTDMLFYYIDEKQIIPIGIKNSMEKKEIIDYYYQGYFKTRKRIAKAKKFIHFMNKNNSRIKVKCCYNVFLKLFVATLKNPSRLLKFFKKQKATNYLLDECIIKKRNFD